MDMFMDKLAQKLNAQEIIKANTSAETEELNRLRSQIAEFNNCLVKLQQLVEDSAVKLRGSQVNGEAIDRLVEESIYKIRAMQQNTAVFEQLQKNLLVRFDETDRKQGEGLGSVNRGLDEKLNVVSRSLDEKLNGVNRGLDEKLNVVNKSVDEKLNVVNRSLDEKLDGMGATLNERLEGMDKLLETRYESMDKSLKETLGQLDQQLNSSVGDQLVDKLSERFGTTEENVHKECVKVYRNVQAVVVEESGKQAEAMNEAKGKVDSLGGKMKTIMGISIAALVFSLVGAVMQILTFLNIL